MEFTGVPPELAATLASRFHLKMGDVYNMRLLHVFFDDNAKLLPPGAAPEKNCVHKVDNETGVVDIDLNFASVSWYPASSPRD